MNKAASRQASYRFTLLRERFLTALLTVPRRLLCTGSGTLGASGAEISELLLGSTACFSQFWLKLGPLFSYLSP